MAFVKKQSGNDVYYKFSDDQSPEDKTQDPNAVITLGYGQPLLDPAKPISGKEINALMSHVPDLEDIQQLIVNTLKSLDLKSTTPEQAKSAVNKALVTQYGSILKYLNPELLK